MFEKNMSIGVLLDFYGDILNERKKELIDMYYNEDMSLSEISDVVGISRQGVRDNIKKAENELIFYENKLGLAERFDELRKAAEHLYSVAEELPTPVEVKDDIKKILSLAQ